LLVVHQVAADCSDVNNIDSTWSNGENGKFSFIVPKTAKKKWKIEVTFDTDVSDLQVWNGKKVKCKGNTCSFKNKKFNKKQKKGDLLELGYQIGFDSLPAPEVTSLKFNGIEVCSEGEPTTSTTIAPTTTTTTTITMASTTTTEGGITGEPGSCESAFEYTNSWDAGANGVLYLEFPEDTDEWEVEVTFSSPITSFETWKGKNIECIGTVCKFINQDYNGEQYAGNELTIDFLIHFSELPDIVGLTLNGEDMCIASGTTTPTSTSTTISTTVSTTPSTTITAPTTTIATTITTTPTTTITAPTTTIATTVTTTPTTTITATTVTTTSSTTTIGGETDCGSNLEFNNVWNGGGSGSFHVPIPMDVETWKVTLTFSSPVTNPQIWDGLNFECTGNVCTFENQGYNGVQSAGTELKIDFVMNFASEPDLVGLTVNDVDVCTGGGGGPTTTTMAPTTTTNGPTTTTTAGPPGPSTTTTAGPPTTTGDTTTVSPDECVQDLYGFAEALDKSLLFYEAQRSGPLPDDMRIDWRKDSALDDGDDVNEDLTGGYYDAGDYVKFGFPMAGAMTLLSWGGISYPQGYEKAGMMDYLRDAVKWGTDYFIKCNTGYDTGEYEFYGQVGNGDFDHSSWSRPEEMPDWRPSYKIDASNPGSDLAAETAASLASAAMLFDGVDDAYATELIDHAELLYSFADERRGKYSDSITDAYAFYNSWGGYNDELVWGAIWLYKATGKQDYLDKAISYYDQFGFGSKTQFLSWDDKLAGAQVLLAQETGESRFLNDALNVCQYYVDYQKSPQGRTHYLKWGSLRYAANAAFICLQASDLAGDEGKSETFREYALGQMEYMLGSTGRSFVVGFGTNPPTQPHHASSSCPVDPSETCDWGTFNSPDPNPHVLYGALVGGPGDLNDDTLNDKRNDYIENEVTLDYNAGFQSLLAGLLQKAC